MSAPSPNHGHCLCGAVTLIAPAMGHRLGACHCGMCRRWAGGPLLSVDCGREVTFQGDENITVYESSAWAERGFCKRCGTHLFYRLKHNQNYSVPIGLFDDSEGVEFDHQIFIDRKPDYYTFADTTTNMTQAEVFAKFAP